MVGKGGIFDDIAGFQPLTTGISWAFRGKCQRQRRDNLTQIPPSDCLPLHRCLLPCVTPPVRMRRFLVRSPRLRVSAVLCVKRAWLSTCPGIPCRGLRLIRISVLQYVKEPVASTWGQYRPCAASAATNAPDPITPPTPAQAHRVKNNIPIPGSARAPRAGFGALAETIFPEKTGYAKELRAATARRRSYSARISWINFTS